MNVKALALRLTLTMLGMVWGASFANAAPEAAALPTPVTEAAASELQTPSSPSAAQAPETAAVPLPPAAPAPVPATAPATAALTSIPLAKGLPVVVRAGVYFLQVAKIDDNEGTFEATLDLRLRWQDLRLAYPPSEAPSGFKEFRGEAAKTKLGEIWQPDIKFDNLQGEPTFSSTSVRLYPDGSIELMIRNKGSFATRFDVQNFPFDRQALTVGVAAGRDVHDKVLLDFRQSELDFSTLATSAEVEGWELGLVSVRRGVSPAWYGQSYSKIEFALSAERQPGGSAAAIFIPLLASLLIPLLSIWLNKVKDGEFEVEAFELTNIIIGGLFAVIALNFTVNAEYAMLSGDNTVSRLFVLNYVTLGVSLLVNLLLFRYNVVSRSLGKYVQEQLYVFLIWGIPAMVGIVAAAVVLSAMA